MRRFAFIIVLGSLGWFGCGPEFERLEIEQLSTPPVPTSLVSDHIQLSSGTGVMIRVKPISGNAEPYETHDRVELESPNLEVLRVYTGEKDREFGIAGCEPGTTYMRVLINGQHEKDIEVTVN